MKVIAFNGSSRKNGNTSYLIQEVFKELKTCSIATDEENVGSHIVHGCTACRKCFENKDGHCIIKTDSMNRWLDKMRSADGIIIGSPVYCADVSGQLKCFIDRVCMVSIANDDMLKRKVAAAVVAVRRAGALAAFHTINSLFFITQMVVVGSSYWNMGFGKELGEVAQDAEGLQTMQNLGKNMAWLLKSIEVSKPHVKEPHTKREAVTSFIR